MGRWRRIFSGSSLPLNLLGLLDLLNLGFENWKRSLLSHPRFGVAVLIAIAALIEKASKS
jgi:hypothetical protein